MDAESPDTKYEPRLGILGGGQLAKMVAEAALRQGVSPIVLARSSTDPAAQACADVILGDLNDAAALSKIAKRASVLTLENEFLDLQRLRGVLQEHAGVALRPGLESIAVAQDKLEQKGLFGRLGLSMAPFEVLPKDAPWQHLDALWQRFPEGFVLKWSRFGYDGRGNLAVFPGAVPTREAVADFCRRGQAQGAQIYAERKVDFELELAMVSTRAVDGAQVYFPLMVSRQERGVCREVFGPAEAAGCDARLQGQAQGIMRQVAQALDLTGSFAVEFFLERSGRLVVNEMAPRVHNSGHYTLFDDEPSQFDLHVQALMEKPLSEPGLGEIAVMRNMLGPWSITPNTACPRPTQTPPPRSTLQWYGKQVVSPGRKMGHLSGRAASMQEAEALREALESYEAHFWNGVQQAPVQEDKYD